MASVPPTNVPLYESGESKKVTTQENALQIAVDFVDYIKKHLGLSRTQIAQVLGAPTQDMNPNVGNTWEFNCKLGTVVVSESGGEIISYFDSDDLEGIVTSMSEEEAQEALMQFLGDVYADFDENRFDLVEKDLISFYSSTKDIIPSNYRVVGNNTFTFQLDDYDINMGW